MARSGRLPRRRPAHARCSPTPGRRRSSWREIAAGVRERRDGRLLTVVEERRVLALGTAAALAAAGDALDGLGTVALPQDEPPHPVRDLVNAARAAGPGPRPARDRRGAARFRARSNGVAGGGRFPDARARPGRPTLGSSGSSKSHATLPFEGDDAGALPPAALPATVRRCSRPRPGASPRCTRGRSDCGPGKGATSSTGSCGSKWRRQRRRRLRRPALPLPPGRAGADQHARPRAGTGCSTASTRWSGTCARARGRRPDRAVATWSPTSPTATEFDVVVVGGGICGAAAAWDAAQRGLSVALLERDDFSGGHLGRIAQGGARRDPLPPAPRCRPGAGVERASAPRCSGSLPTWCIRCRSSCRPTATGMQGGEFLGAGVHPAQPAHRRPEPRHPRPGPAHPRCAARLAGAECSSGSRSSTATGLTGAGVFYDGQMFNPPRLVWAFLRLRRSAGAVAANYCEVVSLVRSGETGVSRRPWSRIGSAATTSTCAPASSSTPPVPTPTRSWPGPEPASAGRASLSRATWPW